MTVRPLFAGPARPGPLSARNLNRHHDSDASARPAGGGAAMGIRPRTRRRGGLAGKHQPMIGPGALAGVAGAQQLPVKLKGPVIMPQLVRRDKGDQ